MNQRFDHELSEPLATLVRSAAADPAIATPATQERLLARLEKSRRPARKPLRPWLAVAATVALAVVVFAGAPMLSGSGDAFAAAQDRFRHFQTLAMTITQRFNGEPLQTSRTLVNARGVLRTDVGTQLSIIVDPTRGRVLTLLHDSHEAMLTTIPVADAAQRGRVPWLEDMRNFTGKATPIATPRTINGRLAHGWTLDLHGTTMELWADANDLPLAMRQVGGGGLEIDYRFDFDTPIAAAQLSSDPPAGYALVAADTD